MKTIAFTILMALLATPLTAQNINQCPDLAIPEASQPNIEWLDGFDLCDEEIHMFLQNRMAGIVFYDSSLAALSELDGAEQIELMRLVGTATPTTDGLIMELRVPQLLMETILDEAQENGADEDWDLPAFDEALGELRTVGDTGVNTLNGLREFAPQNFVVMAIHAVSEVIRVENEAVRARLQAARARLQAAKAAARAGRELVEALGEYE